MKDMTEAEARKALKAAMPWANKQVAWRDNGQSYAAVMQDDGPILVMVRYRRKGALREAVRRCIAAARKVGAAK